MDYQAPLPEPVRRSVGHIGRTPLLLVGSGNQIVVPGQDPLSEGCTDHEVSVPGKIPPRGMYTSDCCASPQGEQGVPGYCNGKGVMEDRVKTYSVIGGEHRC